MQTSNYLDISMKESRPVNFELSSRPVLTRSSTMTLTDVRRSMMSTLRECWRSQDLIRFKPGHLESKPTVPAHRLFSMPELMRAVFDQIESPADLARCARVSHLWFHEAIPTLWRGDVRKTGPWRSPDIEFLVKFAARDPERLTHYLSWVRNLVLCQRASQTSKGHIDADVLFNPSIWKMFSGKLVNLDLRVLEIQEHHIRALLNGRLEELYLRKAKYSSSLLTDLKNQSPRLAEVALGDDESSILPLPEVLDFLKGTQVKDLSLRRGYQDAIDPAALTEILSLPQLERLFLDDMKMSTHAIRHTNISAPLKLTQLTLRIDDSAPLRGLLLNLPELKKLVVEFSGSKGDVNYDVIDPIISTCPNIHLLRLSAPELPLDGRRLEKLAQNCPDMETLMVFPNSWTNSNYKVDASQVTYAASRWPGLRNLFLHQPLETFTYKELLSIGASCPKLKLLGLYGNLDSDDFQSLSTQHVTEKELFPRLRVLDVGFRLSSKTQGNKNFLVRDDDAYHSTPYTQTTVPTTGHQDGGSISEPCTHLAQQNNNSSNTSNNEKPARYSLTTTGIPCIAQRMESILLRVMPNLIMLSHNYNYYAEFAGEWEEEAHDKVAGELSRRFEGRFPSLICEKGWCECWRAGLD